MKFDAPPNFRQCRGTMNGNRVFVLACSGLGVMAFSQLLIAGMALAVRFEEGQKVRVVEREVEKLVPIRISVPVAGTEDTNLAVAPKPELPPVPPPEKNTRMRIMYR